MTSGRSLLFLPLLSFALLSACDANDDEADVPVAGTYRSTAFDVIIRDTTVVAFDVHAAGGRIEMTLLDDGAVTDGLIAIPAGLPETEEAAVEIRFGGTWARSGNTVTFDHPTDTFVRGAEWTYDEVARTLRTDFRETSGDTTEIAVTLRQQ